MVKLSRKVHPNQDDLKKADKWLESKLGRLNDEQKSTILMVGAELLENAVKFHMERKISASVILQISLSERAEIAVTNRFESTDDASVLAGQIDGINNGTDPNEQYMLRLKEIMEQRIPGESRLGLLRIAGEGNFNLDYSIGSDRLTVRASKYINSKKAGGMESLVTKEFAIEIEDSDIVEIVWKGRSRDLNPSMMLDSYLEGLIPQLLDRKVIIDFSKMDSINSSTIPPVLSFLTNLEKRRVRTEVHYDSTVYWQKASFKPLTVLTREFQFVSIVAL